MDKEDTNTPVNLTNFDVKLTGHNGCDRVITRVIKVGLVLGMLFVAGTVLYEAVGYAIEATKLVVEAMPE